MGSWLLEGESQLRFHMQRNKLISSRLLQFEKTSADSGKVFQEAQAEIISLKVHAEKAEGEAKSALEEISRLKLHLAPAQEEVARSELLENEVYDLKVQLVDA